MIFYTRLYALLYKAVWGTYIFWESEDVGEVVDEEVGPFVQVSTQQDFSIDTITSNYINQSITSNYINQ